MAKYPTFVCGQEISSTFDPLDDLQVDRATNGAPRIRALYTTPKAVGNIVHASATDTEKRAMEAFYLANRLVSFTFVWDGKPSPSHTCYFSTPPPKYAALGGMRWKITVPMVEA